MSGCKLARKSRFGWPLSPRPFDGLERQQESPRVETPLFGLHFEPRVELNRSLEMFFGQLFHSEVFQPEADHPMVKRIVGSELVRLFFVSCCFFDSAQ